MNVYSRVVFCVIGSCIRSGKWHVPDSGCSFQTGWIDSVLLHTVGCYADYLLFDGASAGQTAPEPGRQSAVERRMGNRMARPSSIFR